MKNHKDVNKEINKLSDNPKNDSIKETDNIKVILIGESYVGITSIINQFVFNKFDSEKNLYSSQFISKTLDFSDINYSLQLDFWKKFKDKYRTLSKLFCRDAQVVILVYDITCYKSYKEIKDYWYKTAKMYCNENPIFVVVANKIDLYNEQQVSNDEGKAFADEIGGIFQAVSALTNDRIDTLLDKIGRTYFIHKEENEKKIYLNIEKENIKNKLSKNPKNYLEEEIESLKVIVLGESDVGKNDLIINLIGNNCDDSFKYTKKIYFSDINRSLKFEFYDTGGQEKYRALGKVFFKDVKVVIFVYDITCYKSYKEIKDYWYQMAKMYCKENPIFVVVANKMELYNELQVSNDEGKAFADEIGGIFQVASSVSNCGIDTLLDKIGRTYLIPGYNYQDIEKNSNKENIKNKSQKTSKNVEKDKKSKKKDCLII